MFILLPNFYRRAFKIRQNAIATTPATVGYVITYITFHKSILIFIPIATFVLSTSDNLKIKIYKTVALPYGCETWTLIFREECRVRVFENRILRRIFGPKTDENGEWRMLHIEGLHRLYRSPNIVRVIKSRKLRWAEHVARMEEGRSAFKILTGKPK